jgi:hypothetical protein
VHFGGSTISHADIDDSLGIHKSDTYGVFVSEISVSDVFVSDVFGMLKYGGRKQSAIHENGSAGVSMK